MKLSVNITIRKRGQQGQGGEGQQQEQDGGEQQQDQGGGGGILLPPPPKPKQDPWVDTLKLLSRRVLVQRVQPVCRRLYAIAESTEVPSVHIIRKNSELLDNLATKAMEGTLERDLEAIKTSLARHFQIKKPPTDPSFQFTLGENQLHLEAQLTVLRLCPELFPGFQIQLLLSQLDWSLLLLRPFHFSAIEAEQIHVNELVKIVNLDSRRLIVTLCQTETTDPSLFVEVACQWLHYLSPEGTRRQAEGDAILNYIWPIHSAKYHRPYAVAIIERCKQRLEMAKIELHRRAYLFMFTVPNAMLKNIPPIKLFRLDNANRGEVLQLERRDERAKTVFLLRRCPVADLDTAEQFYSDTFDKDWLFRGGNAAEELPSLWIR